MTEPEQRPPGSGRGSCASPEELPLAFGSSPRQAVFRSAPEDFEVEERLGYPLDGAGEHVWLRVRKRGENTQWVAERIARFAGVRAVDVGYAGLKDRHAVASQWFSVHLAGRAAPGWEQLDSESVSVLESVRHGRKLRRGGHAANRFRIVLREPSGGIAGWSERVAEIQRHGVPNYFGPQRFGRGGDNLRHAEALFAGRVRRARSGLRGIWLSAARSDLFNRVLALRVERGCWNALVPGDVLMTDGGRRSFPAEQAHEAADGRLPGELAALRLHPTGPLWGRGASPARGLAAELEQEALAACVQFREGLEAAGLRQERRALRLRVAELELQPGPDDTLVLAFELGRGAYATVVLRELGEIRPAARRRGQAEDLSST